MRWKKSCAVALAAVFLLSACGSSKSAETTMDVAMNTAIYEAGIAPQEMLDMDYYGGSDVKLSESAVNTSSGGISSPVDGITAQKMIKTCTLRAETTDFDNVVDIIYAKVAELSGYVESSSLNGTGKGYDKRSITMSIRIPGESLDLFTQTVEGNTTVLSSSGNVKDVTLDYVDMESHVKALRVEQEALMKLLERAESLEDILILQSQLTQVRYEIESYESRLRSMDNLVTYSTVNLTLREVERETQIVEELTFMQEVLAGLTDNLYDIGDWFRNTAIWLIVSLPYIIIWAVIILIIVFVIRKIIKKKRKKKLAEAERDPAGETQKEEE